MKFSGLLAILLLTFTAAVNAQNPALPTLPPTPAPLPSTPIPPVPMLNSPTVPTPTQVNQIPQPNIPPQPQVQPIIPPVPTPIELNSPAPMNSHSPVPAVTPYQVETIQPQSHPHNYSRSTPSYQSPVFSTPRYSQPHEYVQPPQHSYVMPQQSAAWGYYPIDGDGINPAGAEGVYVGPAISGGLHQRFPYYDYRRPWYTRGPASLNVNIVW